MQQNTFTRFQMKVRESVEQAAIGRNSLSRLYDCCPLILTNKEESQKENEGEEAR